MGFKGHLTREIEAKSKRCSIEIIFIRFFINLSVLFLIAEDDMAMV